MTANGEGRGVRGAPVVAAVFEGTTPTPKEYEPPVVWPSTDDVVRHVTV
jgi:hypothetical protein